MKSKTIQSSGRAEGKGLRFKLYEKTPTDNGGTAFNVVMDQYGRIFEEKTVPDYYPTGKRKGKDKTTFEPTGLCGCANH